MTTQEPSEPNFSEPGTCGTCRHWSLKASVSDDTGTMRDWGECRSDKTFAAMKLTGANSVRHALRLLNAVPLLVQGTVDELGVRVESQFGCRFWEGKKSHE